uniref:Uncharacterized protein n=1 Tax=Arundo donax TaxID=35708 RepID=A0A0A9C1X6_ARUDO
MYNSIHCPKLDGTTEESTLLLTIESGY